jgi:hypothetical protein
MKVYRLRLLFAEISRPIFNFYKLLFYLFCCSFYLLLVVLFLYVSFFLWFLLF